MFDVFRKHTKIMMVVLFLLVIPSFVLFGIDGYNRMQNKDEVVAQVGSVEITKSQWDVAHKNEVDRLRAAKPGIDIKLLDSKEARFATLERMIQDRVLGLTADKAKLLTTDARLARFLQEDPTIASLRKADGKLDMDRYRQLAASQGLTPEGFENSVRQDISRQQVEAGIRQSGFVGPANADVALNAFFEKREIQMLNFLSSDYAARVSPTDAELETFYKANEAMFKAPEQARIEYVVLDMDTVKKGISVPAADVKSYYEQNAARLSGKEERRASHILIAAPKDAKVEDRQAARKKADDLLKIVRSQPDRFAEVAKANSQDAGSAVKGGDLDFFSRGAMVKPFEDAVFAMKKNDISDIVESDFGYHIVKVTDIRQPKQLSLDELRPSIESDLKTQMAQRKYAEIAEVFTNTVYEQADSLKPVADKLGLEIKVADKLLRNPVPGGSGVLASEKFLSVIFSADSIEKKRNTEAVETAINQLVAGRVVGYSPVRTMPMAEVLPTLRQRVVVTKAAELAHKDGSGKLVLWKSDPGRSALPAAVVVARDQQQNVPAQVIDAVLRADTTTMPVWLGVNLGTSGYAVVRVNKVVPRAESAQGTASQDRQQYAQSWISAETQAYYKALKEQLKVKVLVTASAESLQVK